MKNVSESLTDWVGIVNLLGLSNSEIEGIAALTAKPIVHDEVAKDAGISPPTAKKWLSILVSSHIVALLCAWQTTFSR